MAGAEGDGRRLGSGGRQEGEGGQAQQQRRQRQEAAAGALRRHPRAAPRPGRPRRRPGPSVWGAGSGGRGVPDAAPSEEAGGQGPEAGAGEPVQLLQDLHLLLVHLREEGAGERPPSACSAGWASGVRHQRRPQLRRAARPVPRRGGGPRGGGPVKVDSFQPGTTDA